MMGTKVYDSALDLITFSRASGGTALRRISYGSEQFDSDTNNWSRGFFSVDGTLVYSSGDLTHTIGAGDTSGARWTIPIPCSIGDVFRLTADNVVNANGATGGGIGLTANSAGTGYSGSVSITAGQTEVIVVATASPMYLTITTSGSAGATTTVSNISVKEVLFDQPDGTMTLFNHPTNIPRIEYAADGTVKGLLIEEQRTNLFLNSANFGAANWATLRGTLTADAATSPDGTPTADKFTEDATANTRATQPAAAVSVTNGAPYNLSVFLKNGDRRFVSLILVDNSTGANGFLATFDLQNGTYTTQNRGTSVIASASMTPFGDGWYRCSITGNAPENAILTYISPATTATPTQGSYGRESYTGNGAKFFYLWGAQLEAGSFATSYISTSGSAATRSADIASIPVSAFGYNQKAGSLVVDVNTFDADYNNWVWVLDGTSDTSLYAHSAAAGWRVFGAGGTVAYLGSLPGNADAQIGYAYNNALSAALLDGGSVATAAHGQPVAVTTLRLGAASASSAFLNGHIKSIQYYPRRLTNTQLQELTA